MRHKKMSEERLAEIIAAYGALPARWPEGEREAALLFLRGSPLAQADLDVAAGLDASLDMAPDAVFSEALAGRLLAMRPHAASAHAMRSGKSATARFVDALRLAGLAVWPNRTPLFPATAFAASAALGIMVVFAAPSTFGELFSRTYVTASVEEADSAGEQLVALALAENEYPEEWINHD